MLATYTVANEVRHTTQMHNSRNMRRSVTHLKKHRQCKTKPSPHISPFWVTSYRRPVRGSSLRDSGGTQSKVPVRPAAFAKSWEGKVGCSLMMIEKHLLLSRRQFSDCSTELPKSEIQALGLEGTRELHLSDIWGRILSRMLLWAHIILSSCSQCNNTFSVFRSWWSIPWERNQRWVDGSNWVG